MTKKIIIICITTFIVSSCQSQTKDPRIVQVDGALQKWAENPSFNKEQLDASIIKNLLDSGEIAQGFKEGMWVEYSLDTSLNGKQFDVGVQGNNGNKTANITLSATLQKETGNYVHGKKQSTWTLYKSYSKRIPIFWERYSATSYQNGLKEGKEVIYQGFGSDQTPLLILNWKGGIESGIQKFFDVNYPYGLLKVVEAVDGKLHMVEEYYPKGQLKVKFFDTTINGMHVKHFLTYRENGNVRCSGFYYKGETQVGEWILYYNNGKAESISNFSNGKREGNYKYFHENGQLWTEREYKDDRLISVSSNFDKNGRMKDPGTIKNGTGKLFNYDTEGKLIETLEYIDGIEKGSR